jgi:diaminopimelate decarboxylase
MSVYSDAVAGGATDLKYLDVGGGLAVTYEEEAPFELETLARLLAERVGPTGLTLLLEPGRFLVANAGVLLTRVLYTKVSAGKTYVITDAGMNDLLRPSHYRAFHHIEPAAMSAHAEHGTVDVVGPVCESGDFFALDRDLPAVAPGDLLVVHSAGAYGFAMASNYNARPRPAEVVVDGRQFAVVTVRETYQDLVRQEQSTPVWREG